VRVAPAKVKAPAPKPAPAPEIEWDSPPPRRQAGFLNVRATVPAYVYVDGARVRRHTPLRRYRVRPGRRKIAVEAIATGDRHEFTVVISRGRVRTIQELGLKGAPH
jgi:serine/threonine-protein kinase